MSRGILGNSRDTKAGSLNRVATIPELEKEIKRLRAQLKRNQELLMQAAIKVEELQGIQIAAWRGQIRRIYATATKTGFPI